MNANDIKIGNTYFYNNREIKIISREGDTDFFKVLASSSTPEFDATQFCQGCLVGDHRLGKDEHEEYENVINAINDEINSNNLNQYIMFLQAFYIQSEQFEYKECKSLAKKITALKEEISTKQHEINNLSDELSNVKSEISSAKELLQKTNEKCIEYNDELLLTSASCSRQIKSLESINILIKNKDKKISCESILSLIEDSIKLQQLEIGGVENWQWYDDSIVSEEKIKELSVLKLQNLLEMNTKENRKINHEQNS